MFVDSFFVFKQKTAYEVRISDWSSDVCSSDLAAFGPERARLVRRPARQRGAGARSRRAHSLRALVPAPRARPDLRYALLSGAPARQIGRASCRESVCQDV